MGANQGSEALGKVANRGQRRRNREQPLDIGAVRLCYRRQVSREHPGHLPRRVCRGPRGTLRGRCRRWSGLSLWFRQPLPVGPLGDDAHPAFEPGIAQLPPELGAVAASLRPAPLQNRPPRVERVDPRSVQLGLLAPYPAPHRVARQR